MLIGYSDLTALFSAAIRRAGQLCLHGPVVTELGRREAYHAPSLRRLLRGEESVMRVGRRQVLVDGKADGRLLEATAIRDLAGVLEESSAAGGAAAEAE